jgi:dTMP kinase
MLIAFEGLDQSGKETQAERLRVTLEADGRHVETITFPDDESPIGREIRRALSGEREYRPDTLQLLFVANRYDFRPRIEQWLTEGAFVICDRYLASSIAYGEAQGVDAAWLADIQRRLPPPAVTLLLDIQPATAIARKQAGRDRFERDHALLERVRASYRRQAAQTGWVLVDGERPRDDVAADVKAAVWSRLGLP